MAVSSSHQLYVVPFPSLIGNDSDGSLAHPYSSLQQALDHIEHNYYHGMNPSGRTQEHTHRRLSTASISGGVPITG